MSFFGSLYTATSGMIAQSKATSMISMNIANLSTTGYKRSDASFADLVTTPSNNAPYSPGGVTVNRILRTNLQGQIQQTDSRLDASIIGNGFYTVKRSLNPALEFNYTRNGLFNEFTIRDQPIDPDNNPLTSDGTGTTYLRNAAGLYLYAWPLDQDGNLPVNADYADLVPVDIGLYDNAFLTTTLVTQRINLDATQEPINPGDLTPVPALPATAQPPHFVRSLNIVDNAGVARTVSMEFRHITGPMAQFTSGLPIPLTNTDVLVGNPSGPTPGITAGDTLQIDDGAGNTLALTFVNGTADTASNQANTLGNVLSVINSFESPAGTPRYRASLDGNGRLLVRAIDPTVTLDVSGSSANVLGATGLQIAGLSFAPQADLTGNTTYANQTSFPAFANLTDPDVYNWWEMRVLAPMDGVQTQVSSGLINFDGTGSLNAVLGVNGDALIDLSAPIDFDTTSVGEESGFMLDIAPMRQLAGGFNVISSQPEQNGVLAGQRTGVEITHDGRVAAIFNNGLTRDMYQIPLATFVNAEGLDDINGTAFLESEDSGPGTLEVPGTGGAGTITPSTLESSNVDLGDEFGRLIVSQRCFGANAQIIKTIDEMTQRAAELNR